MTSVSFQGERGAYSEAAAKSFFDDDIQSECYGNEAVFYGDDLIGLTTSGAYGFRIKKSLAFAYIKPAFANQSQKLKVLTASGMRLCHIEISAAYDPENEKLRA